MATFSFLITLLMFPTLYIKAHTSENTVCFHQKEQQ